MDDEGFECVLTATSLVIVPKDPEKPCIGPFRVRGQTETDELKAYALDDLGLEPHEFDLRVTIEVDPDIFKGVTFVH